MPTVENCKDWFTIYISCLIFAVVAFFKHVEANIFQDIVQHHLGLKSQKSDFQTILEEDQIIQDSTLYPQIARCWGKRCQIKHRFRPKPRPQIRPKQRHRPKPKPKMKAKLKLRPKPKILPKKPLLTTPKPSERQSINQLDR